MALGRRRVGNYGGGRRAALLSLVENDAVQKDVGFTADETDKLKKLTEEFRAAVVEPEESRLRAGRMSEEERKLSNEKLKAVANANKATTEKFLPKLKEALTADQFTRLQQIYWQQIGNDALADSEMINALPVSKELQDTIKAIHAESDAKERKVYSNVHDFEKKIIALDKEQDAKIDEALTKATTRSIRHSDRERIRSPDGGDRSRDARSAQSQRGRGENDRRAIAVYPRRHLLSLLENEAVQKDLSVGLDEANRIKSLGDEVRTAVRESLGDPPNFEQMSAEERQTAREKIEKTDQAVTDKFLPKFKAILTAEQFARLKQIYYGQSGGAASGKPK